MRTVYCKVCKVLYLDTEAEGCICCGQLTSLGPPDHKDELDIRSAMIRLHATASIVNKSVTKGLKEGSSTPKRKPYRNRQ